MHSLNFKDYLMLGGGLPVGRDVRVVGLTSVSIQEREPNVVITIGTDRFRHLLKVVDRRIVEISGR